MDSFFFVVVLIRQLIIDFCIGTKRKMNNVQKRSYEYDKPERKYINYYRFIYRHRNSKLREEEKKKHDRQKVWTNFFTQLQI